MIGNAGNCHGDKRLCQGENASPTAPGRGFPCWGSSCCRCEVENSRTLFLADKPKPASDLQWLRRELTSGGAAALSGGGAVGHRRSLKGLFYRGVGSFAPTLLLQQWQSRKRGTSGSFTLARYGSYTSKL